MRVAMLILLALEHVVTSSGARTAAGTGTGAFTSAITDLSPGGTYYVRSYATNNAGTAYGEEVSFTTVEGEYAIIVLGRVNDYPTLANALNGKCQVAGSWYRGGNLFGSYIWSPGTGFRLIGDPEDGSAHAINEEGVVAGTLADRTYTWTDAGGIQSYEMRPGFTASMAGSINGQRVLAGESLTFDARGFVASVAATIWLPNGRAVLLSNDRAAEGRRPRPAAWCRGVNLPSPGAANPEVSTPVER
jgi:hypothetical protein